MPIDSNGIIKPLSRRASKINTRQGVAYWFGRPCDNSKMALYQVPVLGRAYLHQRVAAAFIGVFSDIVRDGKTHLIDMSDYGGIYNCRRVGHRPPPAAWSPHAWAIAVDLNVHWHRNPSTGEDYRANRINYGCGPDEIAQRLTDLQPYFAAWGFAWGGHWNTKDPMHFEATEQTIYVLDQGGPEEPATKVARKVVLLPGWKNNAVPIFHEGAHYLSVRDVAEMFDVELTDNRELDGKLYFRKRTTTDAQEGRPCTDTPS